MDRAQRDLELWKAWKADPSIDNLNPLMKAIEPMVIMETNKWRQSTVDPVLLKTHAKNLAFQALNNFNPEKSQLNTHIINNLKPMSRYVINMQNTVRAPEEHIYGYRKYINAKQELQDNLGREPDDFEVKEHLGNLGELGKYKPMIENFYASGDENSSIAPIMESLTMDATAMHMVYEHLNDKQKYIFKHTHGYNGAQQFQNKVIAKKLGISAPAVTKQKKVIDNIIKKHMEAMNKSFGS